MDLTKAGKTFVKLFPTKARFVEIKEAIEHLRRQKIQRHKQQAAIDKRRDEIANMSDDYEDDDYDIDYDNVWEQINAGG